MFVRILLVFSVLISLLLSCNGKDEPIPSYIQIDSLTLKVTSSQGNEIHQIGAVYVYTPKQLLGIFELPAKIPVLESGMVKFSIVPAVYLNGSNNQLVAHSGFLPLDTTINLEIGKVSSLSNLNFRFRPNSKFEWTEDFEDNSSTVVGIGLTDSDTSLITTQNFDLGGRFVSSTKVYTAVISPSDTAKYIDLGSFKTFENFPSDGRDIFLEFDIKCDVPVQLALTRTKASGTEYVPYLYLYATPMEWKHFYVNLVYEAGGQPAGTKYRILFGSEIGASNQTRHIHLDNIRLSYNN